MLGEHDKNRILWFRLAREVGTEGAWQGTEEGPCSRYCFKSNLSDKKEQQVWVPLHRNDLGVLKEEGHMAAALWRPGRWWR